MEIKNGFEVAREIANSFVDGQPRAHALKSVDAYEKLWNENNQETPHYQKVKEFMVGARQDVPSSACIPSKEVRELRAKLILEEAFETVEALGVCLWYMEGSPLITEMIVYECSEPGNGPQPNLEQIVDGCCDIKVVTTGTLIACGVPDKVVQDLVDDNNLDKLARGTIREDGKLIKPPDHQPPDVKGFLKGLGYTE